MPSSPANRFDPPPLQVDGLTHWVLQRAFGPVAIEAPSPPIPEQALSRAGALGLAPRIASRTPRDQLMQEIGVEPAGAFAAESRKALEATLAYDALAARLTQHATRLGHALVCLKGYALHAGGYARAGSRNVGDLDLLVAKNDARAFHTALQQAEFQAAEAPANEQHLPPLAAPGWGIIDVHYLVRGVCDEVGAWMDASAILRADGAEETAPGFWVPGPAMLAAHTLAHAIEQHANNPRPYPLLRMVADLLDALPDATAWEAAMPLLNQSLHPTLEPSEIQGARDLALTLSEGRIPSDAAGPGAKLLAHFLAHALDPEYRISLRGRHFRHRLKQARQRGTLLRYAGRKLQDLWRRPARR